MLACPPSSSAQDGPESDGNEKVDPVKKEDAAGRELKSEVCSPIRNIAYVDQGRKRNPNLEKTPASYRAVSGPSGPKPQKSQKRVSGGAAGGGFLDPNPNFLVRIISGGVGGLPREGVGGGQKVRYVFETQENQTFWWAVPGFLPGHPEGARKV